jgi:photosystem II stability/assembly factor-like uncharacterized protein
MDMLNRQHRFKATLFALLFLFCLRLNAVTWLPFGPYGGDARSFITDPHDHTHLYLGTANGWIYESHDAGGEWKRLARVGKRDDLVLDSIVLDPGKPGRILVGAWVLGSADGGIYVSNDGGASWASEKAMEGQSIRALSAAPSDSNILVAGTLKGIYQSTDGGNEWKLISPEGSQELHEVESIAIDPKDPKTIYAGTWHLPWKTTDGGAHWNNIKQGIIDDSDVFSIIVDPRQPNEMYLSACSGIYKSVTSGSVFQKIQGIPSTARRTRVLMQDPLHSNIVFAGTTEGLWRTVDSGKTWTRTTGPEVIVNDVFVDPTNSNRMLLATDRGGVLASNDGGFSFVPSNNGFSSRQITSYLGDSQHTGTIYVGVVNDKAWGGVFQSDNGGLTWAQKSTGLEGHDVFSLAQAADGSLLAGTRHGVYRSNSGVWSKANEVTLLPTTVTKPAPKRASASTSKTRSSSAKAKTASTPAAPIVVSVPGKVVQLDSNVYEFARSGDVIYAATADGLLSSTSAGQNWKQVSGPTPQEWRFVAASKSVVLTANLKTALLSKDSGQSWLTIKLPDELTQVGAVAVDGDGGLWVGGREGIYLSEDSGANWKSVKNLYMRDVNNIYYDEPSQRVYVTANSSTTLVFSVHLPDKAVKYWNTGWNMKLVRPVGNHMVGATLFDGVVIEPEMVDSQKAAGH